MAKKVNIIGAGLGGLAAACLLATEGKDVTVFEKNDRPGGKINQIKMKGFRFDTGPSLLTMPAVLDSIFTRCGNSIDDYLTIEPVDPICRYFYNDGTLFDCHQHAAETLAEVKRIAPEDLQNFKDYVAYTAALYRRIKDAFLFNPLHDFKDLAHLNVVDLARIDAFSTMAQRIDHSFRSAYLRKVFKRFATYNGSSAYQAPATLNVITHVELTLGGYYVKNGMYQIIEALYKLALQKGVKFLFNKTISKINVEHGRARAVQTTHRRFTADITVANSDATETYLQLLDASKTMRWKKQQMKAIEPSCSALVILLGVDRTYEQLRHHNIFFSARYRKEFYQIFGDKVMPDDPTIYVANTSFTDTEDAIPGGSNLFILVNAPYLTERWNWRQKASGYSRFVIQQLEEKGLKGLRASIRYRHLITPVDFYHRYHSHKGSIYGTSSNGKWSAFLRPGNKSRKIDGLYLTGGSTHPGGGIPLVLQSALNVAELINRYE